MEPGERPDRAIMWKKARKRKDGNIDEDVEEVFDIIVSIFFHISGICFLFYFIYKVERNMTSW